MVSPVALLEAWATCPALEATTPTVATVLLEGPATTPPAALDLTLAEDLALTQLAAPEPTLLVVTVALPVVTAVSLAVSLAALPTPTLPALAVPLAPVVSTESLARAWLDTPMLTASPQALVIPAVLSLALALLVVPLPPAVLSPALVLLVVPLLPVALVVSSVVSLEA